LQRNSATFTGLTKRKFAAGSDARDEGGHDGNYDAILIGSGIGTLTVAVGLARQKHWRCLILEQNFNLGGMTQEFVRKRRYHFDVGLHYVGEMNPGTLTRQLMDYVTGGAVEWAPMPDIFERFV
jgi:all-trans-retinol 13,14-reductase